jgi:hypothetical protein
LNHHWRILSRALQRTLGIAAVAFLTEKPFRKGKRYVKRARTVKQAMNALECGQNLLGYTFYSWRGKRRKSQGKDFALHFGQINHYDLSPIGLCDAEVARIVTDCLRHHGVKYRWDGNPKRPIRVVTASISTRYQQLSL